MFTLGGLAADPASAHPDLLDAVGVVGIDPDVSDTAATQQAFGLAMDTLANCVVVGGKREGVERIAACLVLATNAASRPSGFPPAGRCSSTAGWRIVRCS